ncbi:hypothetical protein OVA14_01945 [Agrococcus sp. SL85]|uniref:hypothetical protein n=1 Tax=Agrococcus sp. SL85 TaxID=2995141 RepID=UPI00226D0EE6|nr:hypothetical protein [Agrococcus sp. SL85]WAC66570.1 hypothetical protein OVA14_01945 [Agrococcus sp. SL85]
MKPHERSKRLPEPIGTVHPTEQEAVEHLYGVLAALDPNHTVAWSRLQRLTIYQDERTPLIWHVIAAEEIQTFIELLRLDKAARDEQARPSSTASP